MYKTGMRHVFKYVQTTESANLSKFIVTVLFQRDVLLLRAC